MDTKLFRGLDISLKMEVMMINLDYFLRLPPPLFGSNKLAEI